MRPYPKHKVEPGWSYEESQEAAFALEELLKDHGISIRSGSPLETHILRVMRLSEDKATGIASSDPNIRETYRTLIGVHELAKHILLVRDTESFSTLIPHLSILNDGHALQNTPSRGTDQATNKLFELLAASFAMRCGTNVTMDDPYTSTGRNPDVLATMRDRRWGIACKVIHSPHPEGFVGHLIKGIDQIENSPAEIGVVLFNLKEVIPHDSIWPLGDIPDSGDPPERGPAAWPDPKFPYQILLDSISQLVNKLLSYLPEGHLETLFESKKSIPGFLLWAHSTSAVLINDRPTPTAVRMLTCHPVAQLDDDVERVVKCLNAAAFMCPTPGKTEGNDKSGHR